MLRNRHILTANATLLENIYRVCDVTDLHAYFEVDELYKFQ